MTREKAKVFTTLFTIPTETIPDICDFCLGGLSILGPVFYEYENKAFALKDILHLEQSKIC